MQAGVRMLLGLANRTRRNFAPLRTMMPEKRWAQLRALARMDAGIVITTMLALNLLRIISSLILTRLLAPADFGILGMVTILHYAINMLFDVGTDTFIFRHHDIKEP